MDRILYPVTIGSQAAAALIISNYDPSHSTRAGGHPTTLAGQDAGPSSQQGCSTMGHVLVRTVTQAVRDPSPPAFIAALSLYTLLALVAYRLHRRHRLENHFLIVGVCVGGMISSASSLLLPGKGLAGVMQSVLPWTFLLASVGSAVAHAYVWPEMIIDEGDADGVDAHKWDRKTGPASLEKDNLMGM